MQKVVHPHRPGSGPSRPSFFFHHTVSYRVDLAHCIYAGTASHPARQFPIACNRSVCKPDRVRRPGSSLRRLPKPAPADRHPRSVSGRPCRTCRIAPPAAAGRNDRLQGGPGSKTPDGVGRPKAEGGEGRSPSAKPSRGGGVGRTSPTLHCSYSQKPYRTYGTEQT